jgi:hypothetical protein
MNFFGAKRILTILLKEKMVTTGKTGMNFKK